MNFDRTVPEVVLPFVRKFGIHMLFKCLKQDQLIAEFVVDAIV